MALLTSCTDTNKLTRTYSSWSETFPYLTGSSGIGGIADLKWAKIIHTNSTIEYVGLTESAAKSYVDSNPATVTKTGGVTTKINSVQAVQQGESPMYSVVIDQETITDPVQVTE